MSYNTYLLDKNGNPIFGEQVGDLRKGDLYVSVSNILSCEALGDFITYWLLKTFGGAMDPIGAHRQYMKDVSGLGTRIHAFVEADLIGESYKDEISEDMMPAIESWYRFRKKHEIEVLDIERILYSRKYRFAGTLDSRLRIDGVPYIVDLKTGTVADKAFVQLTAYDTMLKEMGILEEPHNLLVLGGADSKHKMAAGGDVQMHTLDSFFKGRVTKEDLFIRLMCLRQVWFQKNVKSRKFQPIIKHIERALDPLMEKFAEQFRVSEGALIATKETKTKKNKIRRMK